MGRKSKSSQVKKNAKKAKGSRKVSNGSPLEVGQGPNASYTVDQVLDQAEGCIDLFNYDVAQMFCQRALQMEPDNLRALETTGSLLLELGDMEGAKHCFGHAVELSPDEGHAKYMYLGQLLTDKEAAQSFLKGIELMKKELAAEEKDEDEQPGACCKEVSSVTVRDISSAYCSVAEIYLTDACFEEDAEAQCKESLEQALEIDSSNPEVHHLFASFYLSKDNEKAAGESMDKGLSLWLPQLKTQVEKPEPKEETDPVETCMIGYPARVNAVKILIELKKYEVATEVLELLLDEDDTVVEVWYLLGWSNFLQGEDFTATARYYLHKAQKVAAQTKCEDKDLVSHIEELLQEIGPGEVDNSEDEDGEKTGEMDVDISSSSSEEDGGDEEDGQTNSMEH